MNRSWLTGCALVLAIGAVGWISCSRKADSPTPYADTLSSSRFDTTQRARAPLATDASGDTLADSARSEIKPAPAVAELRAQIAAERSQLERTLRNGDLGSVPAQALRIRDLVVALAGKMSHLPDADAAALENAVAEVTQTSERLGQMAREGNRAGTRTELETLRSQLTTVLTLTASARR